ncbi:MAG: hypothetical protein D6754_14815, partial [Alphaproteobacteria bacterium]
MCATSSAQGGCRSGADPLPDRYVIELADPEVSIRLRRSRRARRLTLRLDARDGSVHLTAPAGHPHETLDSGLRMPG